MADHLQAGRDLLQYLGDILSDLGKAGAATIGADRPRMVHDLLARQMIGQRAAYRLTLATWLIRRALHRRRRPRRFACLQILQHPLELLDLRVELLR